MKYEQVYPSLRIQKSKTLKDTIYYDLEGGLTKREYFAGLAMQGLVVCRGQYLDGGTLPKLRLSEMAIDVADELIKELNKKDEK